MVINLEDMISKCVNNNLVSKVGIGIGNYLKNAVFEKVDLIRNPRKVYEEFIELGKKEGLPFMYYAIGIEVMEDVVLPGILVITDNSEYIPVALAFHTEPVMYPLWFLGKKIYNNLKSD